MRDCDNIVALARELKVNWRLLYRWRAQADVGQQQQQKSETAQRESELQEEIARLKTALADKVLEVDFFKGALQKIETLRRQRELKGGGAFTTKSGK
jgi:transposase-like protein